MKVTEKLELLNVLTVLEVTMEACLRLGEGLATSVLGAQWFLPFWWALLQFSCCGGISYRDWSQNMYFNCSEDNPSRERCSVPYSCCLPTPNQVSKHCVSFPPQ